MNYLIAVLPDRIQAESAYTALEKENIPTNQMAIVGRGYQTVEEFDLINPGVQAKKGASLMAFWLIPFGFAAGYGFNLQTGVDLFPSLGPLGNHLLGGLFGAIAAAMGSVFVGGGVALSTYSSDALPYSNRLQEGKYLVVVKGSVALKNQATEILQAFKPEILQGYVKQP